MKVSNTKCKLKLNINYGNMWGSYMFDFSVDKDILNYENFKN